MVEAQKLDSSSDSDTNVMAMSDTTNVFALSNTSNSMFMSNNSHEVSNN
jgi:hypothetical protein